MWHGIHQTPFGLCLVAVVESKICYLSFINRALGKEIAEMRSAWPGALFKEDAVITERVLQPLFFSFQGKDSTGIELLLKGTPFQLKVWQVLLMIPVGTTISYAGIANLLGKASHVRAVANAVARNPVAYAIPCHRVIYASGEVGNYRWGSIRKRSLLAWEQSKNLFLPRLRNSAQ